MSAFFSEREREVGSWGVGSHYFLLFLTSPSKKSHAGSLRTVWIGQERRTRSNLTGEIYRLFIRLIGSGQKIDISICLVIKLERKLFHPLPSVYRSTFLVHRGPVFNSDSRRLAPLGDKIGRDLFRRQNREILHL